MDQIRRGAKSDTHRGQHWLALLVALVLLGQPVLCVADCAIFASVPVEHGAVAFGFYCPLAPHHHQTPEPEHAPPPAFWPGVLALVALVAGELLLLARVVSAVAAPPAALHLAPPVPPPR